MTGKSWPPPSFQSGSTYSRRRSGGLRRSSRMSANTGWAKESLLKVATTKNPTMSSLINRYHSNQWSSLFWKTLSMYHFHDDNNRCKMYLALFATNVESSIFSTAFTRRQSCQPRGSALDEWTGQDAQRLKRYEWKWFVSCKLELHD